MHRADKGALPAANHTHAQLAFPEFHLVCLTSRFFAAVARVPFPSIWQVHQITPDCGEQAEALR